MEPKTANAVDGHTVNILYIHGGAYISEITVRQWEFLAAMINAASREGISIIFTVPIYSLITPNTQQIHSAIEKEHGHGHAHAVMLFLKTVYKSMAEKSKLRGGIQIMGDEAGGGLAYSLAVALDNNSGLPPPSRVILLSPWLDVHLQNPGIEQLRHADPTKRLPGLREAGRLFSQGTNSADPLLFPLYAKVEKSTLLRVYIWTSDADVCQADCTVLIHLASKKGVNMSAWEKGNVGPRYNCEHGLYPSWMFSTWTPEAKKTIDEVVKVIKEAAMKKWSPVMSTPAKESFLHSPKPRSVHGAEKHLSMLGPERYSSMHGAEKYSAVNGSPRRSRSERRMKSSENGSLSPMSLSDKGTNGHSHRRSHSHSHGDSHGNSHGHSHRSHSHSYSQSHHSHRSHSQSHGQSHGHSHVSHGSHGHSRQSNGHSSDHGHSHSHSHSDRHGRSHSTDGTKHRSRGRSVPRVYRATPSPVTGSHEDFKFFDS